MNLLQDIITYIRRIIKSPSDALITDNLLIDYINRFWIQDVDARMQLFDLKTKYQFQTSPGVDQYNMPLYDPQTQPGNQTIASFPVYQGFFGPAYVNGVEVGFHTQKGHFFGGWPNVVQYLQVVATGDGGSAYTFQLPILSNNTPPNPPNPPIQAILRGHVDMTGIIAYRNNGGGNIDPIVGNSFAVDGLGNTIVPTANTFPAVYFTSSDSTGANVVVSDSGQFFTGNVNTGILMEPGNAPLGNRPLPGGYQTTFVITGVVLGATTVITATTGYVVGQQVTINNIVGTTELNGNTYTVLGVSATTVTLEVDSTFFTPYVSGGTISSFFNFINYYTGEVNVAFPRAIPPGVNINAQCYYFQAGLPRAIFYYNNVITLRSPPDKQYLVELDAYLTPAAFLATGNAIPFGYMAEYIARGAARKILSDTGDWDQFNAYEPLFLEQESLVHIRSQRQFTATRTQTIYSQGNGSGNFGYGTNNFGGGTL